MTLYFRLLILLLTFPFVNIFSQNPSINKDDIIKDFVQIYHGYESRPSWHANQIKHYIYRDKAGKPEWLFDGFLFLEIYARFGGKNYDYGAAQPGKFAPDKAGWENLICKYFEDTRGPDAIEEVMDSLARLGYFPPLKRKVVFSIPNPIYGVKNWGFIQDKALDFSDPQDRYLAIEWYINRILEEWERKKYKHINFGGFYWIHEQIDFIHEDDVMLKTVNNMLKEKGVSSYWLPHLVARGVDQWDKIGFTYAYKQPNYFFYPDKHPNAINETIKDTQRYGLGIMMEFDGRAIDKEPFRKLFFNYVNTFQKEKVWEKQAVNYYDGGNGWLRLATETGADAREMYRILSDIIVKRQNRDIINYE